MDKLKSLEFFIATASQGSFVAASNTLGADTSTISKAISRLEKDIGFRLFHRTTRKLNLTSEGEQYLKTAQACIAQLSSQEEQLSQSTKEMKGKIRINSAVSYGRRYVRPLISAFQAKYPDIEVELTLDDAYVDMVEKGIDLCFRSGTLEDSGFYAKKLSPMDFLICASPAYIEKHGAPTCQAEFVQHKWIRFQFKQTGRVFPTFYKENNQVIESHPNQHILVDDGELMAELCADGQGITQIPHFIAHDWIKSGHIVPILPYYSPKDWGVFLVYTDRGYLPLRVRAFIDFVVEKIQEKGENAHGTWARQLSLS